MAGGEGGREGGGDCCGAVGVGFPSPPCRNGLAIMGKLKPGIQPSTSLLVCKRACCLRWRVESPVCHIHDVFPRDTQHTAPWQHDIYIYTRVPSPTSFHPLLSAQPVLLLPPLPFCPTSLYSPSAVVVVLVSSAELVWGRWRGGVGPAYVSIASRYVEYVYRA